MCDYEIGYCVPGELIESLLQYSQIRRDTTISLYQSTTISLYKDVTTSSSLNTKRVLFCVVSVLPQGDLCM